MLRPASAALRMNRGIRAAKDSVPSARVLIADVERVAQASDHHAIDAAVKTLAEGTESFAALRMNRGIRAALAGRNITDV
jgi:hypothetical protein